MVFIDNFWNNSEISFSFFFSAKKQIQSSHILDKTTTKLHPLTSTINAVLSLNLT